MLPISSEDALMGSTEDSIIICHYPRTLCQKQPEKHTGACSEIFMRQQTEKRTTHGFAAHLPFLSFAEQEHFCSQGLISEPSGYSPDTASANFYKNGKTAVFCISSPLCDGVIGLSVLLAAILQWDSSTLQAVWWESRLLSGSSASSTQRCQGDFTHYSTAIWLPSPHHMHLTSFKFCLSQTIMEILPAWVVFFVHLCHWFFSNVVLYWSNILPPFFCVEINPASWDWKAHYRGDSEQKPH